MNEPYVNLFKFIDKLHEHGAECTETIVNLFKYAVIEDVAPVVHGQWEDAVQGCHDSPHVACSACGEYYWQYFKEFNYCPNCGAKMDGEVNDD